MATELKNRTKFLQNVAVFLPAILHFAIALPIAYYLNIWVDEASTLNTTEHGVFEAFRNTIGDEKQAPLYFWMMSLWREINSSILFARLFSIICSVLAIGIFHRLARKLWDQNIAIIVAFFFALHPYLFWASVEIRVYAMVVLLTVVQLSLFFEGFFGELKSSVSKSNESAKKFAVIAFPIVAIISLYVNYYNGFILVGCFLVLLAYSKWQEAKTYFLQMLGVGILFIPMLLAMKAQLDVRNSGHFDATNPVEGVRLLWGHFLYLVLPTETFPPDIGTNISYARLWIVRILLLVVIGALIKYRSRIGKKIISFSILSVVIFGFLYFSYFLLGSLMLGIRHISVLFVPLYLLLISIIVKLAPRNPKFSFAYYAPILILLMISYSYALFAMYPNLTKRGDWARVSGFIEKNESADQPIFIFPNFEALALPYYYKGKNTIRPNDNFHKWFSEAEYGSEGTWTKQIQHYTSIIPKDSKEIWLLTYLECHSSKACVPLDKFVSENYNVVLETDFYEERVRLLRKK